MTEERVKQILWLPIPALAVPVRVTLNPWAGLDALCRAVLGLLRLRECTPDELAEKLGFARATDLVVGALAELEDRGMVARVQAGSTTFKVVEAAGEGGYVGSEIRLGWAFLMPDNVHDVIPRLWLGKEPPKGPLLPDDATSIQPSQKLNEVMNDWFKTRPEGPSDADLRKAMNRLVHHDDLQVLAQGNAGNEGEDDHGAALELPRIESFARHQNRQIQSIVLDSDSARREHRFHYVTLWTQVDFLPRISQSATVIFHQPELIPMTYPTRPMSAEIRPWLKRHDGLRPLLEHVDGHAAAIRENLSVVLKLAGIEDVESLEHAVDVHQEALFKRLGMPRPAPPDDPREVVSKIRDAWRWLHIYKQDPERWYKDAARCYAAAIEAFAQSLRDLSLEALRRWAEQRDWTKSERREFRESRKSPGWWADRAGMVGLGADLGPSGKHVKDALHDVSRLLKAAENAEAEGAGNSVTLWLLPAFLLNDDDAVAFARPIAEAFRLHPLLTEDLDDLLNGRNSVFHDRGEIGDLDLVDQKLVKAWAAVHLGREIAAQLSASSALEEVAHQ